MNKGSPDLLFYILVIAGILLFNYLTQRAARRQREQTKGAEPPEQEQDEPPAEVFGRARPVPAADLPPGAQFMPDRPTEAQPAAEVPRRRSAVRSLLTGRRNLRGAIVVMTVLGPCRALERPSGPPGGAQ